jgi:hypothetical protein
MLLVKISKHVQALSEISPEFASRGILADTCGAENHDESPAGGVNIRIVFLPQEELPPRIFRVPVLATANGNDKVIPGRFALADASA